MKTTLEIPDALFKQAKLTAAQRGIPFRELVSEALMEKLAVNGAEKKPWLKSFGQLRSRPPRTRDSAVLRECRDPYRAFQCVRADGGPCRRDRCIALHRHHSAVRRRNPVWSRPTD